MIPSGASLSTPMAVLITKFMQSMIFSLFIPAVLKAHLSIALMLFITRAIDRCAFNTAGMNKLKIVNASRGFVHQYENVKRKLLSPYSCVLTVYIHMCN